MFQIVNINDISKEDYEHYYSLMSGKRKIKVDSFRHEEDKKRSICGDMTARKMIANLLSLPEDDIHILTDEKEKPYAENTDVFFNISHSGDYVLCVLTDSPVGADIEKIRKVDDNLVKRVCNPSELVYVFEDRDQKEIRFFMIWTAKEAYFKCKGTGINNMKNISSLDLDFQKHLQTFFEGDYVISIYTE